MNDGDNEEMNLGPLDDPTGIDDGGEPGPDDALTVDEMIERLEAIRLTHGGKTRIYMPDQEPVCKVCLEESASFREQVRRALRGEEEAEPEVRVVVCDRF